MTTREDGRVLSTGGSKRWRRKRSKLSANYYNELRENLPGQGPVRRPRAKNTKINMSGVWKKWMRYCRRSGWHATASLHSVQVLRTYSRRPRCLTQSSRCQGLQDVLRWTLDHYPGIKKKSSLHQYFRLFKMLYEKYTKRWMNASTVKTVNSVSVPSRENREGGLTRTVHTSAEF